MRDASWAGSAAADAVILVPACNVALATVPADLERGTELTVDVFGDQAPAWIERDVLYDPDGERIRG